MKNLVAVFITLLLFSTGYAAKTKEQKMQKKSLSLDLVLTYW